jgi:hypothetical protein
MYVIFSGEGVTDFGTGTHKSFCCGNDCHYGPLTSIVDKMIEQICHYSIITNEVAVFVDGAELERIKTALRPAKKSIRIPGDKVKITARYHFEDARALAIAANKFIETKTDKNCVAILFRDSNTIDKKEWNDKIISMLHGFTVEDFHHGVPMLPKPVSEAWILCAIYRGENPNRNCNDLENRRHGDRTDHALKHELEEQLGEQPTRELLNEKISSGEINHNHINLSSFNQFKEYLTMVITDCQSKIINYNK